MSQQPRISKQQAFLSDHDDSWEFEHIDEQVHQQAPTDEEAASLYYPGGSQEPQMEDHELATLDELADRVEVSRLIDMSALKPLPEGTHSLDIDACKRGLSALENQFCKESQSSLGVADWSLRSLRGWTLEESIYMRQLHRQAPADLFRLS